jgi:hypothetical protein
MRALRRFLILSTGDRILVVSSAAVLVGIWLGLRLVPFNKILQTVDSFSRRVSYPKGCPRRRLDRVVWSVLAVSRYSPLTLSCLVQALAAKVMLSREGYHTLMRMGVATSGGGELRAHAWLECNGEIIVGGTGSEGFRPLPCFERGPS